MSCPHGERTRWTCRPCKAAYMAPYMRAYRRTHGATPKTWVRDDVLAVLGRTPTGLRTTDLQESCRFLVCDPKTVRRAVTALREAGHPIVGVKEGRCVRYRLEDTR